MQFCDKLMDQSLRGDGSGRASFETFPTFVVDPPTSPISASTTQMALMIGGWFRGTPFRSPLQGGLKGLGARGGGDEGLKVEGGFTFGRLQGGFKGA